MSEKDKILQAKQIHKSFGAVQALKGVNLKIEKGRIHTLVGENGSGKSTLVKIITGVYERDSGDLYIKGKKLDHFQPRDVLQKGVHTIYQDLSLVPTFSVAKNISLPGLVASDRTLMDRHKLRQSAEEALEQLNLEIDLSEKVENLDVGTRQLVAIARAYTREASLIIMDEPTASLTRKEVKRLFTVIENLKNTGVSILFISHKMNEVLSISDYITVIRDGENVVEGPIEDFDQKSLERHLIGKQLDQKEKFDTSSSDRPLLELKSFGKQDKFKDVDLQVRAGEIVALTGLLGSGRNDLALSLFGIEPADSGQVMVDGESVSIISPKDALENHIAYLPKDRLIKGLALEKSVEDNIVAYKIESLLNKFKFIDREKKSMEARKWIEELNIETESKDAPAINLSGGNQQKVVLGKTLSVDPKVLVLHSPTFGVDIGTTEVIHHKLQNLARESNKAILLISDDISEIMYNSSRVILMRQGQISERLEPKNLTHNKLYEYLIGEV